MKKKTARVQDELVLFIGLNLREIEIIHFYSSFDFISKGRFRLEVLNNTFLVRFFREKL